MANWQTKDSAPNESRHSLTLQSAHDRFMTKIFYLLWLFETFEMLHPFKGFIINLCIVTPSCSLISRYDHVSASNRHE